MYCESIRYRVRNELEFLRTLIRTNPHLLNLDAAIPGTRYVQRPRCFALPIQMVLRSFRPSWPFPRQNPAHYSGISPSSKPSLGARGQHVPLPTAAEVLGSKSTSTFQKREIERDDRLLVRCVSCFLPFLSSYHGRR